MWAQISRILEAMLCKAAEIVLSSTNRKGNIMSSNTEISATSRRVCEQQQRDWPNWGKDISRPIAKYLNYHEGFDSSYGHINGIGWL